VGESIDPAKGLVTWAIAISCVCIFGIIATIWQFVGVWRSAGNHKSRGGRGFWAGAARVMVVLGVLGFVGTLSKNVGPQLIEVWKIASGDPDVGSHKLRILRGGTELEYSGGITFGATDEVRRMLDADQAIRVIHLNSNGGREAEARNLRDLVRDRKLITYTSSICASACTYAFLGGVQRYMAPDARLGFHRGDFPGFTPEQLAVENETAKRWLVANGVPAWFAERAYSTPSDSMWWPTLDELKQAGVVTAVARSDDFAVSGLPSTFDRNEVEAGLLQVPAVAAIKRVDQTTYAKILNAVFESLKVGKSKAELAAVTTPFVAEVAKKYIPIASDTAVSEITEVLISEIDVIGSKSADACYRFLFPNAGGTPIAIADYVSNELMQRDLNATAAVIESGATSPQRIPAEGEVAALLKTVVGNMARKYPADEMALFADLNSPIADRRKVCKIVSALYREVMMLQPRDKVRLLRYLFSQ
jgi:hypothetical protein